MGWIGFLAGMAFGLLLGMTVASVLSVSSIEDDYMEAQYGGRDKDAKGREN
jgi:hypothetical protein